MKKHLIRIIIVFTIAVLVLSVISGCTLSAEQDAAKNIDESMTAVVVILGAHANSLDLNLNSPLIKDIVAKAISSFGFISVVSVDGAPDLIAADNYDVPVQYRGNPQLLQDISKKKTANLLAGLTKVRANNAEVDTLEAMRLAVRTLASAPEDAEKIIIIVDTGLSTIGLLDFRNNIINAEPQIVAELLAEKQAIPNLANITVKWQQLGDVSAPQQSLSPAQVLKLEAIWRAIIEKVGGKLEISLTVANPGGIGGDLPDVSVVEFPPDEPIRFAPDVADPAAIDAFEKPQFLSDDQVQFIGDSDQYLHPEVAVSVITPIAEYMKANSDFTMLLVGTTAGDNNNDYCLDLSQRRAEAVKATLVSLGVPDNRVITAGLGSADPWHIYDAGFDGPLAAQNRKVVLISADTLVSNDILNLK